jgi:hypothetical protein
VGPVASAAAVPVQRDSAAAGPERALAGFPGPVPAAPAAWLVKAADVQAPEAAWPAAVLVPAAVLALELARPGPGRLGLVGAAV